MRTRYYPSFLAVLGALTATACLPQNTPVHTEQLRTEQIAIGVNAFLWQAAVETLGFLPIASSDPYGGVLASDWYSPPNEARERFRVTAQIVGKNLRADALRLRVVRQTRSGGQEWETQPSKNETRLMLENAIFTRARELRIAALAAQ